MTTASALQKRIKRHVVGRVNDYFVVAAPGLEKWCLEELEALPSTASDIRAVAGGVAFKGRLVDCWLANLHLRCASRVLLRIDRFQASGFSQFDRRLGKIPWELYLNPGPAPAVKVTVRHCRLYHSGAIQERVIDAAGRRLGSAGPVEPDGGRTGDPQRIYIRGVDDRFVVSVDSSGDNLYKRGIKTRGGSAPLRETTAAAVLKSVGYVPGEPLVDAMCGSGTFSIEAAMVHLNLPAGGFRTFAFESWPSFQPKRWRHLRRDGQPEAGALSGSGQPTIFASDSDPRACETLAGIVRDRGWSRVVTVAHRDFFSVSRESCGDRPGLVVLNPPYGVRLGGRPASRKTLARVVAHLDRSFSGWRFALVVPGDAEPGLISWPHRSEPLFHGGVKTVLLTGNVP